jgi:hypothetical protein
MRKALNPWEGKPAVSAFWSEFLTSHQETDVVLPDTSVSLSVAISKNPIALNEYLNHSYKDRSENSTLSADRKSDLQEIFRHNLVTFGDVHAAQHILALDPASTSLHLTVARFFTADALKRDNVILIGGKEANPWVYLFDGQTNFSLAQDSDLHLYIANHHPLVGEEPNYAGTADQNLLLGYCVIAYLPNPSRTGNAIILAGTDSDATSAAAEFLASEDQMSKFRSTIHADKFPYFEVLLKTSRLSGTSFNAEVIAYRIHPEFR